MISNEILISLIFAFIIFVIFLIISFSKREDYYLDDYTEDDHPDNVRFIEKNIEEKEKLRYESEIESLKESLDMFQVKEIEFDQKIEVLYDKNKELIDQISQVNIEKDQLEKRKSDLESNVNKERELINKLNEDFGEISKQNKTLKELKAKLVDDVKNLEEKNNTYISSLNEKEVELSNIEQELSAEKTKLNESISELSKVNSELDGYKEKLNKVAEEKEELSIELENHLLVEEGLNKDITNVKNKLKELDRIKEENKNLLKSKEMLSTLSKDFDKELKLRSKVEKKLETAIEDRNHFSKLIDKKENVIRELNEKLAELSEKETYIFEGIDDLGEFKDVYSLEPSSGMKKELIKKIQDINEQLDSDQFAYYVINTLNNVVNVNIKPISEIEKYVELLNRETTRGKYKVFLILRNKVYQSTIY